MSQEARFSDVIVEAICRAEIELPGDVVGAIERALERETDGVARGNLEGILANVSLAREKKVPMCQDTGMLVFFVEVGEDFHLVAELRRSLHASVGSATECAPLRPCTVDPFSGSNTGDNLGRGMPIIHWDVVPGDSAKILIAAKGGGSENSTVLSMMPTSTGEGELRRLVLEKTAEFAGRSCPPVILGLGVGGTSEKALLMAKKASLRKLGISKTHLEEQMLEDVNSLGIGPMGLGGRTTALSVNIEYAQRHPATFPVALVIQCWGLRRSVVEIDSMGAARILEDEEWR